MTGFDELLSGNLDGTMDFLNEKKAQNSDGIYRIDLTKAKDKKRGYRSVIRFLPNLTKDGKLGASALEKISHYVKVKGADELNGWFDSPKNFGEKCPLSDLYYAMTNSKNAVLMEKAKCLNYSRKYYSYVLVLEDENQPELVGKIMIFQYGKTIKDKIQSEKDGDISGSPCNVFRIDSGKDFVIWVKEITTGDETYPDYKNSMFKPDNSTITIFKDGVGKNVPLSNGQIDPKFNNVIKDFLLNREFELEDYAPKKLTEEQQSKINEISAYLSGKSNKTYSSVSSPSTSDFDVDDDLTMATPSGSSSSSTDEDDFFGDL
jgi:hypothetical protein